MHPGRRRCGPSWASLAGTGASTPRWSSGRRKRPSTEDRQGEMMGEFTVADLRSVLLESISDMDLEGTAETSYADLGCDSLALMDVAARIRQRVGVQVPDDAIAPAATQAATVAAVNRLVCGHTEQRVRIEAR